MRIASTNDQPVSQPLLIDKAQQLDTYLKTLSTTQIAKAMKISPALAEKTQQLIAKWNTHPEYQSPAIDSFVGDIYSGLQADSLTNTDRQYANQSLRILSGLYGILRPLDGIMPYRLEMAYKFPKKEFSSLYDFWGNSIIDAIPKDELIINTSSAEYTQTITPFAAVEHLITPTFLTINPTTKQPTQVIVHTKIARGAFARWLITSRQTDPRQFKEFSDLGYTFNSSQSTTQNPVFICHEFGGIGLSQRLK